MGANSEINLVTKDLRMRILGSSLAFTSVFKFTACMLLFFFSMETWVQRKE